MRPLTEMESSILYLLTEYLYPDQKGWIPTWILLNFPDLCIEQKVSYLCSLRRKGFIWFWCPSEIDLCDYGHIFFELLKLTRYCMDVSR
jgi:hypothetical protein